MSQISPSVLRSLSALVDDQINYVCLVEYIDTKWYLALANSRFFFVKYDLSCYKDPAVPFEKIKECRLCSRRKTLLQIVLIEEKSGAKTDPSVILDQNLTKTYDQKKGEGREIKIYTLDRRMVVDSLQCYWTIDYMIRTRNFGDFPLVDDPNLKIPVTVNENQ